MNASFWSMTVRISKSRTKPERSQDRSANKLKRSLQHLFPFRRKRCRKGRAAPVTYQNNWGVRDRVLKHTKQKTTATAKKLDTYGNLMAMRLLLAFIPFPQIAQKTQTSSLQKQQNCWELKKQRAKNNTFQLSALKNTNNTWKKAFGKSPW